MNKKIKILAFNRSYLPGYLSGGATRSIANIVSRLGDEFDFKIVTLDRDSCYDQPFPSIIYGQWQVVGKAHVMYFDQSDVNLRRVIDLVSLTRPDIIYLNSFFDPIFTQRILWVKRIGFIPNIPIVIAPRGELSNGALGLKKFKKKIFIFISKVFGLYKGLIWQASSKFERFDIQHNFPFLSSTDIHEAMDLSLVDQGLSIARFARSRESTLYICFLSRIVPMKNLDFALRVLKLVKSKVVFTIYGPKTDPSYWVHCEDLIFKLNSNVRVVYEGELPPHDVLLKLSEHDLFLFPSRGENYGHVIHEALGAGLPVLISDQTPWGDVVENRIGWVLPLDQEAEFARVIDDVASWDELKLLETRRKSIYFALERAADPLVLNANRELFLSAAYTK